MSVLNTTGRGKKACDNCKKVVGPRTKICPGCGRHFHFKVKAKDAIKTTDVDWTKLKKGQVIKVVAGYGPHYTRETGERVSMGYSGLFKVSGINRESHGIEAYPHGSKHDDSGFCFIYMGPTVPAKTVGIRESHKIELVTNGET